MMQNFNHERFAFCAMSTRFARVCLEVGGGFGGFWGLFAWCDVNYVSLCR